VKRGAELLRENHVLRSEEGMVLVLTLAILVLLTAMVTEFSYDVYTATSALYNWRDSQRLSFVARSGMSLAAKTLSDIPATELYRFPGRLDIPLEKVIEGFEGSLVIEVEDENAKFNLNSLVSPNGLKTAATYDAVKRLLRYLGLDEIIADRVVDWIDPDSVPSQGSLDSEVDAKNNYMDSTDELLAIRGIDLKTYEKLLPYVTVYGKEGSLLININTATVPVIMSLSSDISRELAERVVEYRKINPFRNKGDLQYVPGFGTLYNSISGMITTGSSTDSSLNYRIRSVAEENKIKRVIESVVEKTGPTVKVKYWCER
jgi:type II secretory pathway component PulK